jgi:hypothetical protein
MVSDRARVSFDATRRWTGVIAQQGRVTLEADANEARAIAEEADRARSTDVIGPAGVTPDDGYRVVPVTPQAGATVAAGDFTVRKGTLYAGGLRVALDDDLRFTTQNTRDWADYPTEIGAPDSQALPTPTGTSLPKELMYVLLREHEVSAVEDPALREVALGGPDTAQRGRIVQRVLRHPTSSATAQDAWSELTTAWAGQGYTTDPGDLRLLSTARLKVDFTSVATQAGACQPQAVGGYLGAENQLIRVQICDADASGAPVLVWGYDNASFLYRVTARVDPVGKRTTLTLLNTPVDAHHQPQQGQFVEVLRTAAMLDSAAQAGSAGSAATGPDTPVIASGIGHVAALTGDGGYDPNARTVVLGDVLPPEYTAANQTPVLFLRVWQGRVSAPIGTPVALGDTGVRVTLTTDPAAPPAFHKGDYWSIGVRPDTPTQVYPQRLLTAGQPPDGPRVHACPLGLVQWTDPVTPTLVNDARGMFMNLVQLTRSHGGGVFTATVGPEDVKGGAGLQSLIDSFQNTGNPVTIFLKPGTYLLPAPLVLSEAVCPITIDGGDRGALLAVDHDVAPNAFTAGLIVLNGAHDVILRGLSLVLPAAPFTVPPPVLNSLHPEYQPLATNAFPTFQIGFGVRLVDVTDVTIERCAFSVPRVDSALFMACIFSDSGADGLTVRDCSFTGGQPNDSLLADLAHNLHVISHSVGPQHPTAPPFFVITGLLQMPVLLPDDAVEDAMTNPFTNARYTQPKLSDAVITGNVFYGMAPAALTIGESRTVAVRGNVVRESYGGFWLLQDVGECVLSAYQNHDNALMRDWLSDPVLLLALLVGSGIQYASPAASAPTPASGPAPSGAGAAEAAVGAAPQARPGLLGRTIGLLTGHAAAPPTPVAERAAVSQIFNPSGSDTPVHVVTDPSKLDTPIHVVTDPSKLGTPVGAPTGGSPAPSATAADWNVPQADDGTASIARLDISGNQVDAVLENAYSGAALLVTMSGMLVGGVRSVMVTGNRLRCRSPHVPATWVVQPELCAVTGNLIDNEVIFSSVSADDPVDPAALRVDMASSEPGLAVAGNVLAGGTHLPGRSLNRLQATTDPFLKSWDFLNTVLIVSQLGSP